MYSRLLEVLEASNVASAFLFFASAAASAGCIFTGLRGSHFLRTTFTPSPLSIIAVSM